MTFLQFIDFFGSALAHVFLALLASFTLRYCRMGQGLRLYCVIAMIELVLMTI